jgi:hypothetical protein
MDQNKNQPGQQKPGPQTAGQGQQKPGQQNPGQSRPGQQTPGQKGPGQQNPGQQKPGGARNIEDEGLEDVNRNRDEAEGSRENVRAGKPGEQRSPTENYGGVQSGNQSGDDISGQGSSKERNQGGVSNREFDRELDEQSEVPSRGSTRSGSER